MAVPLTLRHRPFAQTSLEDRSVRFSCPSCNKMYRLPPDRMAGYQRAQISCPNCKASIIVRDLGGDLADARLATREVSGPVLLTDVRPQSAIVPADPTWFVAVGRDRKGPFTPLQLSELLAVSTISAQSLVWQKGMTNWVPMVDVLELRPLLRSASDAFLASGPPPMRPRPLSSGSIPAPAPMPAPAPIAPAPAAPAPAAFAPVPAPVARAPRPVSAPTAPAPAAPAPVPVAARPVPAPAPAVVPAPVPAPAAAPLAPTAKLPQVADSDLHALQTETHSESFFTSHHDLDHVALSMPDADKHKPTKEEYQNLLQEFSVMFRLDKRSKIQKILITVIVASLVIGAVGFGLVIRYQGMKKMQLLADANNILGMFNLPYQTSVTIDVGNEAQEAAKPGEPAKAAKATEAKQEVQLSDLAAKMRTVVKARKVAVAKVPGLPQVSEEEKKRLMALLDSGATGPRGATIGEAVTASDIRKMCEAQKPTLRACGQAAGVAEFKLRFSVGAGGKVADVKATADGKDNAGLASCSENKLRKVHLAGASAESFTCTVD